jgi:long-chain acyl-CoA synthetase
LKKDYVSYIEANALAHPNDVILHGKTPTGWSDITWREFRDDFVELSQTLISDGVKEEDRIIIFSPNMTHWHVADMAIMGIRAVTVPVYATSSPSQLLYIASETESHIIFVGTQLQYDVTMELIKSGKISPRRVVVFDNSVKLSDGYGCYFDEYKNSGVNDTAQAEYKKRRSEASENDLATIIYTSGTTGEPKGVMLGHDNIMQAMIIHDIRLDMKEDDTSLCFLPLCHVFERGWSWFCLYKNCPSYVLTDTKVIAEALPEVAPSCFCSVPRVYEKVYQKVNATILSGPRVKRIAFNLAMRVGRAYNEYGRVGATPPWYLRLLYSLADALVFKVVKKGIGGRLRIMPTAGAHVPSFIVEFFHAMGIKLMVGYGLTETTATVSARPYVNYQLSSIGLPLTDIEVRIGDNDEILVRSKTVMRGYYKKPEATAEVIDSEGWFHTGDAGMIDADGNLYITERIKDLMKTSQGKYVAPQMLEARLTSDMMIEQAVVAGDGRPYVTAFIVPNFEQLEKMAQDNGWGYDSREELVSHPAVRAMYEEKIDALQVGLAGFEQIKKFTILPDVFTMDTGELTPTLKVRRKIILGKLHRELDLMYAGSGNTSGAGEK